MTQTAAASQDTAMTPRPAAGLRSAAAGMVPAWVISQRRGRGDCETCGERPAETEWAGTGEMICWECCDRKRCRGLG